MLDLIYKTENLKDKLDEQMINARSKGVYIFVDNKDYNNQNIDDNFIANHISIVSNDESEENPIFKTQVSQLSLYAEPFSANKQFGSTKRGLWTIYSSMFSLNDFEMFRNKYQHFYEHEFSGDKIKNSIKKVFSDKVVGKEYSKKEMSILKDKLSNNLISKFNDGFDVMDKQCKTTYEFINNNIKFIERVSNYFKKYNRLYFVVDNYDLTNITEEGHIYYSTKLFGNTDYVYKGGEIYYPVDISHNFNKSKSMVKANLDSEVNYEYIKDDDLLNYINLYLFLKTCTLNKDQSISIYTKDNKIISHKVIGSHETKFVIDNKSFYVVSQQPIFKYNSEGIREYSLTFKQIIKGELREFKVKSLSDLGNQIFYGRKEEGLFNQFYYISDDGNMKIRNKYYDKTYGLKNSIIYEIKDIETYKINDSKLYFIFNQLKKDALTLTNFRGVNLQEAIRRYINMNLFFNALTKTEFSYDNVSIKDIKNDEDYILSLVNLTIDLMQTVNKKLNKEIFDSEDLERLLRCTRVSLLENMLNQNYKKYDYIFKEERRREKRLAFERGEEYVERLDYFSYAMKEINKYKCVRKTINKYETLNILSSNIQNRKEEVIKNDN